MASIEKKSKDNGTFQMYNGSVPEIKTFSMPAEVKNKQTVTPDIKPFQLKPNNTGLPNDLKTGVEQLSGFSMDDVNVHYNSEKPVQMQAFAFAQGTDIHVAAGQEKHVPHEAWHVVQQKQGRVKGTMQMNGLQVNDDSNLEQEADAMGEKAINIGAVAQCKANEENRLNDDPPAKSFTSGNVIQRAVKLILEEDQDTEWDSVKNKKIKEVIAYELRTHAGGSNKEGTHGRHIVAAALTERYLRAMIVGQTLETVGDFFVYGGTNNTDKNMKQVEMQIDDWVRSELRDQTNISIGAASSNMSGGSKLGTAFGKLEGEGTLSREEKESLLIDLLNAAFDIEAAEKKVEKRLWKPKDLVEAVMKTVQMLKIVIRKKADDSGDDEWKSIADELDPRFLPGKLKLSTLYRKYLGKSKLKLKKEREMRDEISKEYREGRPGLMKEFRRERREGKIEEKYQSKLEMERRKLLNAKMKEYDDSHVGYSSELRRPVVRSASVAALNIARTMVKKEETPLTPVKTNIRLQPTPQLSSPSVFNPKDEVELSSDEEPEVVPKKTLKKMLVKASNKKSDEESCEDESSD
ncbi:DUF4157 domain-containing protein [Chitinophaga sp. YR573]|uniref:eCIS core domain-containing protein n=1 Tax=Chitinophaga sp. YR573 TaxID=1881040 RepID=UPI0015A6B0E9|nr:DUF4157 domain-containing protein [Chitinophaga sp. YR573]